MLRAYPASGIGQAALAGVDWAREHHPPRPRQPQAHAGRPFEPPRSRRRPRRFRRIAASCDAVAFGLQGSGQLAGEDPRRPSAHPPSRAPRGPRSRSPKRHSRPATPARAAVARRYARDWRSRPRWRRGRRGRCTSSMSAAMRTTTSSSPFSRSAQRPKVIEPSGRSASGVGPRVKERCDGGDRPWPSDADDGEPHRGRAA